MAWCDGSEENRLSLSYYLLFRNSFSALGNRAAPVFSAKVGRAILSSRGRQATLIVANGGDEYLVSRMERSSLS